MLKIEQLEQSQPEQLVDYADYEIESYSTPLALLSVVPGLILGFAVTVIVVNPLVPDSLQGVQKWLAVALFTSVFLAVLYWTVKFIGVVRYRVAVSESALDLRAVSWHRLFLRRRRITFAELRSYG